MVVAVAVAGGRTRTRRCGDHGAVVTTIRITMATDRRRTTNTRSTMRRIIITRTRVAVVTMVTTEVVPVVWVDRLLWDQPSRILVPRERTRRQLRREITRRTGVRQRGDQAEEWEEESEWMSR